ncbi:MAG: HD domain-containing protein [Oligoflexia bacterium]|nr:HD domain-containing protein [Oligoflexia bacterium]
MKQGKLTYDPLYGFIRLTETENKIVQSPFYQRLRWIKQLGFSSYIFPGAEHTRFAHALGVMHMADQIVRAIGRAVPDEKLFDPSAKDSETLFHKSIRISALLHDIGTFPFSHTCEGAYIKHGDSSFKASDRGKPLPNNHEHLGAFILKNTNYDRGITKILEDDHIDTQEISRFIKGTNANILGNQILHSEVDCDRMDYLMRDAHYTGLKYGQIDREFILYHMTTFPTGSGKESLAIRENALHSVEDFLIARFGWYSQVIRNSGGAKYDIIAETVTKYFLEKRLLYQFQDLLQMIENEPDKFFGFNDFYFMSTVHKHYLEGTVKNPKIREMMKMLLFHESPVEVQLAPFEHKLVTRDENGSRIRESIVKKIEEQVKTYQDCINQHGDASDWLLYDIPDSDIAFSKAKSELVKKRNGDNLLEERDPVKIMDRQGNVSLLIDRENSIIRILSNVVNFIPVLYMSPKTYQLLVEKGLIAPLE